MTKINHITGKTVSAPQKKPNETQGSDKGLFNKNLASAMGKAENEEDKKATLTAGLNEIRSTLLTKIESYSNSELTEKTESLISTLEKYVDDLNNPGLSLKDLEALVNKMELQSSALKSEAEATDDSALKDIVFRCVVPRPAKSYHFPRAAYF